MTTVMELTAVVIWAFSAVLQVTPDTEEISADKVTTTVASGKAATIEITANELIINQSFLLCQGLKEWKKAVSVLLSSQYSYSGSESLTHGLFYSL